jgi:hypothetical protein
MMVMLQAGEAIDGAARVLSSGDGIAVVGLICVASIGAIVFLGVFGLKAFGKIAAGWNASSERAMGMAMDAHKETAKETRQAIESLERSNGKLTVCITEQTTWLKATRKNQ